MFIYTNTDKVLNSDHVEYFHIVHDEDINKYNIVAVLAGGTYTTVGEYDTKEEATKVLRKLYNNLGDECILRYNMSTEEIIKGIRW